MASRSAWSTGSAASPSVAGRCGTLGSCSTVTPLPSLLAAPGPCITPDECLRRAAGLYLHAVDPVVTAERFGRALTPLLKSTACNLIITPFINIPLYYMWSTTRLPIAQWDFSKSFEALQHEWAASSLSGIALWGPAQWFQFAMVPVSLRIPFMSGVAFVWSLVISLQAQYGNVRPAKGFH